MTIDPKGHYAPTGSPQHWNRYSYASNNPMLRIDPDGQDDFIVFRPYARATGSAWGAIQREAPKYGNTVTVLNGNAATTQAYATALGTPDTHVVFAGHSVEDASHNAGSVHLANGDAGTYQSATFSTILPTQVGGPNVQADSVAVFACNGNQVASQYSNATTFTGASGGTDGATTLKALDGAAAAYTDALVRNGSMQDATSAANTAINASIYPVDHDGDIIITTMPP